MADSCLSKSHGEIALPLHSQRSHAPRPSPHGRLQRSHRFLHIHTHPQLYRPVQHHSRSGPELLLLRDDRSLLRSNPKRHCPQHFLRRVRIQNHTVSGQLFLRFCPGMQRFHQLHRHSSRRSALTAHPILPPAASRARLRHAAHTPLHHTRRNARAVFHRSRCSATRAQRDSTISYRPFRAFSPTITRVWPS